MKRICFFSGDISRTGGTERVSLIIAGALAKRGYEVTILSIARGEVVAFDVDKNIKLFSLHGEERSSNFSNIKTIKMVRHFLKSNNIDYIIDVDIIQSIYSIPASFGLLTKVISWEHFNYFVNVGDLAQRVKRKIARLLASRFSTKIVTLTSKDATCYRQNLHCHERVIAINNPVISDLKSRCNLHEKTVIAVGRLTRQKGFDLLLKAWKIAIQVNPEWRLMIVGSGEEDASLKALAKKLNIEQTVLFVAANKNINEYYLKSSIYAMSSRFEGFPMVLLEAKSFGLPIVSFDCETGPREIVNQNFDGLLVEKENYEKFSDSLLSFMNDENKRKEFGENAFNDRRYVLNAIIPKWQGVLV
jgi:glycosyltransferase involved in cell wall biosynthesis